MTDSATGIVLETILARTRRDLAVRKANVSVAALRDQIARSSQPVSFLSSLRSDAVAVIAEFKRASPSKGHFGVDAEPATVASSYIAGGASAISCLTDEPFFAGALADLADIAAVAAAADPPVGILRKDFIVDEYQVEEARAFGASCILLIVAALDDTSLRKLVAKASDLNMGALIEVHDEAELERALGAGADLIGINNRNLRTLDVDLGVTERLAPGIPSSCIVVGESGIATPADVARMASAGVDAILVGESIIMQPDWQAAVQALVGAERRDREPDKIHG